MQVHMCIFFYHMFTQYSPKNKNNYFLFKIDILWFWSYRYCSCNKTLVRYKSYFHWDMFLQFRCFNSFHYDFQITNPKNRICTLSSRNVIYKLLFEYVKILQIREEGYKHPIKWDYGTKARLQRFFHVNLRHEDKEFQKFSPKWS